MAALCNDNDADHDTDDDADDSKGDNYDEDVEDETAGLWMMRAMHNVLFGQYVFLPTEQAEAYDVVSDSVHKARPLC